MKQHERKKVRGYMRTLKRIPRETLEAVMSGVVDFNEADGARCIVGWALRDAIARAAGVEVSETPDVAIQTPGLVPWKDAADRFGGDAYEWQALYGEVCDGDGLVEEAVGRVLAGVCA